MEKAGRVAREAPARPETVEAAMSVGRLSLSAAAMNLWLRCTAGAPGFVVRRRGADRDAGRAVVWTCGLERAREDGMRRRGLCCGGAPGVDHLQRMK